MTVYFMRESLEKEDIEEIKDCLSNIRNNIYNCCQAMGSIFSFGNK